MAKAATTDKIWGVPDLMAQSDEERSFSVIVDTIDLMSIKQGTITPPKTTSKCGQDNISLEASLKLFETNSEPVEVPPKLWLYNPGDASFLKPELGKTLLQSVGVYVRSGNREELITYCIPLQYDQAADSVYI